jgi:hypothetical protein
MKSLLCVLDGFITGLIGVMLLWPGKFHEWMVFFQGLCK